MSRYERVTVNAPPETVVSILRALLGTRGFTEYAVVDHARDMARTGQASHPAWTVIFGNPAAGAKLLAQDLAAAVDIPLRLAIIESGGASEIVWRDMRSLLADVELADSFTTTLRTLATTAGDQSTQRSSDHQT
jgi:uncharacterized protein (DUF302 family)